MNINPYLPTIEYPGVKIWDNLIDDLFLLNLDQESDLYNWEYTNIANTKSFPNFEKGTHKFWAVNFLIDKIPSKILDLYNFLNENIIQSSYKVKSVHLNGQSMGQNGTVHLDSLPNSNEKTLMVFINFKWQKEWEGEFQLLEEYNNNAKIIENIKYIPGRIVLFDGSIPHRGLAPTEPYVLRKSLVFRLIKNE